MSKITSYGYERLELVPAELQLFQKLNDAEGEPLELCQNFVIEASVVFFGPARSCEEFRAAVEKFVEATDKPNQKVTVQVDCVKHLGNHGEWNT